MRVSEYWPTLKPTRHQGLRAARSCTAEAATCAASAGTSPTLRSSAKENIVDTVTSPSPETRGISSGSSSPSTTLTASAQNSTLVNGWAVVGKYGTTTASSAQPSAAIATQKTCTDRTRALIRSLWGLGRPGRGTAGAPRPFLELEASPGVDDDRHDGDDRERKASELELGLGHL